MSEQSASCSFDGGFILVSVQWTPHDRVSVRLRESVDKDLVVFTWPAAYVLAAYIATCDIFRGKSLLEIGAGVGLPSLVAGKRGVSRVVVTDRNEETTMRLIQSNIDLNSLESICSVVMNLFGSILWPVVNCA